MKADQILKNNADFLVFDSNLLTAEPSGFSHNIAGEVYICGKKMK